MSTSLRFPLRWLSYPLVFGGSAAFMVWALYAGVPYWPSTPLVAAVGLLAVAGLERIQPFREGWLEDGGWGAMELKTNVSRIRVRFTRQRLRINEL